MGFAAGLKTGTGLIQSLQENERADRAEGRAQTEFDYKQSERVRKAAARNEIPKMDLGLPTDSPVAVASAAGPGVPPDAPDAPPTSVAATGATGVPPEPPAGTQLRVAAAQAVPAAAPALGLGTPGGPAVPAAQPTDRPAVPAAQAAPGAAPDQPVPAADAPPPARAKPADPLSTEMRTARALFNYARENDDIAGMNAARADIRTTAMRDYSNQAGKMTADDAFKYVHENLTMEGGMPISIAKQGKNGYTMMSWDKDGDTRLATLNGAQIKQLVAADLLMKNGFADEGMKVASGVHKDLNDLIGKMNTSTQGQATVNNAATHNAVSDAETARAHRASESNAAAGLQLRRDAATREKAGDYDPVAISPDGKTIQVWDNKMNRMASVPVQEGTDAQTQFKYMQKSRAAGKATPDKEIPKPGTMMSSKDGDYQSDGKGGRISVNAPLPDQRAGVLKKLGFSGGDSAKVTWTPDGEHITFPGATAGYNVNDPSDMVQMQKDMSEATTQRTMGNETASRVATAPARRAVREQQMNNLSDPNRFGPGVGLPLRVPQDRRDLYINTDE